MEYGSRKKWGGEDLGTRGGIGLEWGWRAVTPFNRKKGGKNG